MSWFRMASFIQSRAIFIQNGEKVKEKLPETTGQQYAHVKQLSMPLRQNT